MDNITFMTREVCREVCEKYRNGHSLLKIKREFNLYFSKIYECLFRECETLIIDILKKKYEIFNNPESILTLYKETKRVSKLSKKIKVPGYIISAYLNYLGADRTSNKYNINKEYFDIIDAERKAIVLGFIAADGWIDYGKVNVKVSPKDVHILKFIIDEIGGTYNMITYRKSNAHIIEKQNKYVKESIGALVRFYSTYMTEVLKNKYGIVPAKSTVLKINFENIPEKYWPAFIYGYFLGNGALVKKIKYCGYEIYSGSREFLLQISNILDNLEIHNIVRKGTSGSDFDYRIFVHSKDAIKKFFDKIVKPYKDIISIERKCKNPFNC